MKCMYMYSYVCIHFLQEFLVQRVEEEPLVKNNSQCKDFLIEAMKYHLLKGDQRVMYKTPRTKARTPIGLPKVSTVYFLAIDTLLTLDMFRHLVITHSLLK